MKHDSLETPELSYAPCRYGNSKMFFRGPRRSLRGRYIAFVGGTETYGKFIRTPFPQLVEEALGETCVNFGCVNASVGAFLIEPVVVGACNGAVMNVVQVMGAHNLSNRFYTVHPRRNDRFLRATTVLQAIFPEVDFSDFCFTRHMLSTLHDISAERFEIVRAELETAWTARMRSFLNEIGSHTLLLWFSDRMPSDAPWADRDAPFQADPLFVTRHMVDSLRPLVQGVVLVQPTSAALTEGTRNMSFLPFNANAAAELLGPRAHVEAAERLTGALRSAISGPEPRA